MQAAVVQPLEAELAAVRAQEAELAVVRAREGELAVARADQGLADPVAGLVERAGAVGRLARPWRVVVARPENG